VAKGMKTKEVSRDERRVKVAGMYVKGYSQHEIALALGVSQPTVSLELKALRDEWVSDRKASFDEKMAEELAKIDHIEKVAWEAWERSCKPKELLLSRTESVPQLPPREDGLGPKREKVKGRVIGEPTPVVVLKTVEEKKLAGQVGDDRFLGRVSWCIETRCKLLGLLREPEKNTNVNVNVLSGEFWADLGGQESTADAIDRAVEAAALPPPNLSSQESVGDGNN